MKNILYIRKPVLGKLPEWRLHSRHATYREAVIKGQELLGHTGFMVDTPGRVPSREEQLLLPFTQQTRKSKPKSKSKLQAFLADI